MVSKRENYIYRTASGDNAFMVSRFEGVGAKKKFGVYTIDTKGTAINPTLPPQYTHPNSRPLLDLPEIASKSYILLVEGERTARFAAIYLPSKDWGVTTWSGGAKAIHNTNWLPLEGKTVVCWPDNDDAGRVAMHAINDKYLSPLSVPCGVVNEPIKFAHKWDLADDLPDGISAEDVVDIINDYAKMSKIFENPTKQADDLPFDDNVHYLPANYIAKKVDIRSFPLAMTRADKYRPLGHFGEKLFFLSGEKQSIVETTIEKLCKLPGLMGVVSERDYWDIAAWQSIVGDDTKSRPDYVVIAGRMAKQCYEKGIFTYDGKMRGRGFWHDRGTLVLHLGDKILAGGKLMDPSKFVEGNYVYEIKEKLINYNESMTPLTDEEGQKIVLACTKANWSNPVYASLYAGWLVTGLMGGSLEWRPHIWITGNKGCGKTTLYTHVCKKVFGDFAVWIAGESTEPGIRKLIKNDSRPVGFDEAEGMDKRSIDNIRRVIGLLRASSSDNVGQMVKGSASHSGVDSYELRCSFYLTSIGDSLTNGQDKERVTVLSLKSPTDIMDPKDRQQKKQEFMEASDELDKIPDLTARLIKRVLTYYPSFTETLVVFKREASHYFNSDRHGDQVGTLLAGRWMLTQSTPVTAEIAKKTLAAHDWKEMMGDLRGEREDIDVINQIFGATIKCELSDGRQSERKIAELISVCLNIANDYEVKVRSADAEAAMARFGIRIANFGKSMQVAITSNGLVNDLMKGTPYEASWAKVLRRHPDSLSGNGRARFAGQLCRFIEVPLSGLFTESLV